MARQANSDFECLVSGTNYNIHKHHIFGNSYRKKSEQYGFVTYLTGNLHNLSPQGVHFDKEFDLALKRKAQQDFEAEHTREEFIQEFGMSYILDDSLDYEEELQRFLDRKRDKLGIYV